MENKGSQRMLRGCLLSAGIIVGCVAAAGAHLQQLRHENPKPRRHTFPAAFNPRRSDLWQTAAECYVPTTFRSGARIYLWFLAWERSILICTLLFNEINRSFGLN